jgi:hypothetical protein
MQETGGELVAVGDPELAEHAAQVILYGAGSDPQGDRDLRGGQAGQHQGSGLTFPDRAAGSRHRERDELGGCRGIERDRHSARWHGPVETVDMHNLPPAGGDADRNGRAGGPLRVAAQPSGERGHSQRQVTGLSSGQRREQAAGRLRAGHRLVLGVEQQHGVPGAYPCAPGEDWLHGLELGVKKVNASGGVLGWQLKIVAADNACDPATAVAATRKLIEDKVSVILGSVYAAPARQPRGHLRRGIIRAVSGRAAAPHIPRPCRPRQHDGRRHDVHRPEGPAAYRGPPPADTVLLKYARLGAGRDHGNLRHRAGMADRGPGRTSEDRWRIAT